MKMLITIKDNPCLLETFDDQCIVWWNKKGMIDFIIDIINSYYNKISNVYSIAMQFKSALKSMIDEPDKLLEIINEYLKPKQKERQEHGEVPTPLEIISDMLNNLDKHYFRKNGKSIFSNKNLKWGDIMGSWVGNFSIVVYQRLFEGLKEEIPWIV